MHNLNIKIFKAFNESNKIRKPTFHIMRAPIMKGLNTVRKQYTEARSKLDNAKGKRKDFRIHTLTLKEYSFKRMFRSSLKLPLTKTESY